MKYAIKVHKMGMYACVCTLSIHMDCTLHIAHRIFTIQHIWIKKNYRIFKENWVVTNCMKWRDKKRARLPLMFDRKTNDLHFYWLNVRNCQKKL